MRALRVCRTSGCTELTKAGLCDSCKQQQSRNRASERMDYGAAWRRTRAAFIARYPACFGCGKQASHVDHIDGQGIRGDHAYDWSNLQSLCVSCHAKKTVAFDGGFGRYAADGKPLDM